MCVDRMVELGRQPEGMELLAQALFTKGMIACGAGDYVSAFTALQEGVDLATRMNAGPRLLRCQNTLGWTHHDLGNIDEAIAQNSKSLELATELRDPETISFAHLNLVDCYPEIGQHDEAAAHLEPVIQESRRDAGLGDKWMRWRYTLHLDVVSGWLALHQGETSAAMDMAGACVDAARAAGSIRYVGRGLRLRGLVLAECGDMAEAETALTESLSAANEVGNPYQTWRTLASLSEVRFTAGRLDEAAATARDALIIVDGVAHSLSDTAHVAPLLSCAAVRTLREWADHAGSEAPDLRNPLGAFT